MTKCVRFSFLRIIELKWNENTFICTKSFAMSQKYTNPSTKST